MHGMNNMDVINAQQARIIHHYKNTKEKLLKANAAVCLNKVCRLQHLIPKYIQTEVNGNNTRINALHHKGHNAHLLHVLLPQRWS